MPSLPGPGNPHSQHPCFALSPRLTGKLLSYPLSRVCPGTSQAASITAHRLPAPWQHPGSPKPQGAALWGPPELRGIHSPSFVVPCSCGVSSAAPSNRGSAQQRELQPLSSKGYIHLGFQLKSAESPDFSHDHQHTQAFRECSLPHAQA